MKFLLLLSLLSVNHVTTDEALFFKPSSNRLQQIQVLGDKLISMLEHVGDLKSINIFIVYETEEPLLHDFFTRISRDRIVYLYKSTSIPLVPRAPMTIFFVDYWIKDRLSGLKNMVMNPIFRKFPDKLSKVVVILTGSQKPGLISNQWIVSVMRHFAGANKNRFSILLFVDPISRQVQTINYHIRKRIPINMTGFQDWEEVWDDRMRNIKGDTLRYVIFNDPPTVILSPDGSVVSGSDAELGKQICKMYNADCVLVPPDDETDGNSLSITSLVNIFAGIVDICFNSNEGTLIRGLVTGTYPYEGMAKIAVIIPKQVRTSTIANMVMAFDDWSWLLIVLVFVTLGLLTSLKPPATVSLNSILNRLVPNLLDSYFRQFEVVIFAASSKAWLMQSRVIFMILIVYSFFILSFFTSILTAFITLPSYYPSLNDLNDLNQSNVSLIMSEMLSLEFQGFYGDNYDLVMEHINVRQIFKGNFMEMLESLKENPEFGLVTSEERAKWILNSPFNVDSNGFEKYHLIPDFFYESYKVYNLRGYSIYEQSFNYHLSAIAQAGLLQHWRSFDNVYLKLRWREDLTKADSALLGIEDFRLALIFTVLGWTTALIVFALELLLHRCRKQ